MVPGRQGHAPSTPAEPGRVPCQPAISIGQECSDCCSPSILALQPRKANICQHVVSSGAAVTFEGLQNMPPMATFDELKMVRSPGSQRPAALGYVERAPQSTPHFVQSCVLLARLLIKDTTKGSRTCLLSTKETGPR
jgi:hypothetical protein